jgi:hypothetical protein
LEQKSQSVKNTSRQLFNRLPPPDRPGSNPLAQLSDLYSALPPPLSPAPASTAPEPSLPAKPNNSSAVPKVVIDLTDDHYVPMLPFEAKKPIAPKGPISADTHPADVKAAHPSILAEDPHQYIFNTTDDLATRQTERSWAGSYRADDWVFGREELHADQVDRDRALPILLWDAGYPLFVSLVFFLSLLLFKNSIRQYLRRKFGAYISIWRRVTILKIMKLTSWFLRVIGTQEQLKPTKPVIGIQTWFRFPIRLKNVASDWST